MRSRWTPALLVALVAVLVLPWLAAPPPVPGLRGGTDNARHRRAGAGHSQLGTPRPSAAKRANCLDNLAGRHLPAMLNSPSLRPAAASEKAQSGDATLPQPRCVGHQDGRSIPQVVGGLPVLSAVADVVAKDTFGGLPVA